MVDWKSLLKPEEKKVSEKEKEIISPKKGSTGNINFKNSDVTLKFKKRADEVLNENATVLSQVGACIVNKESILTCKFLTNKEEVFFKERGVPQQFNFTGIERTLDDFKIIRIKNSSESELKDDQIIIR